MRDNCPICSLECEANPSTGDFVEYSCGTCGTFRVAGSVMVMENAPTPLALERAKARAGDRVPTITTHDLD